MPNIVAHYVCGNLVARKLQITDKEFIKGNLYPDYVDKNKHYRIKGRMFEIPDIERFMSEEQMSNQLFKLGFLTHLMLDKLFLDNYVVDSIYSKIDKRINIFTPERIYQDYTNISNMLLNYYHLDIEDIDNIMLPEQDRIDILKYRFNTEVIKECKSTQLQYLDFPSFITFLDNSSEEIAHHVKTKKYIR